MCIRDSADALRPGDAVLAVDAAGVPAYAPVELRAHADAGAEATFVRLELAGGRALTLTRGHYVPTANRGVVEAGAVEAGDELSILAADGATLARDAVVAVVAARHAGLFAPLTKRGRVVVDGVVASEYSRGMLGGARNAPDAQALYEAVARVAFAVVPTSWLRASDAAVAKGGFAALDVRAFFARLLLGK